MLKAFATTLLTINLTREACTTLRRRFDVLSWACKLQPTQNIRKSHLIDTTVVLKTAAKTWSTSRDLDAISATIVTCENLIVPYNLGSVLSLQFNYLFIKSDSRSFEPFYHGYVFWKHPMRTCEFGDNPPGALSSFASACLLSYAKKDIAKNHPFHCCSIAQ